MPHDRQRNSPVVLLVQSPHDDGRGMYAEFFRHHDLTVSCPDDVAEALLLAPSADVIVTGLQLPGALDGYAFIQRLRVDEQTREKPIIVLTSWGWQTERLRAEDAGRRTRRIRRRRIWSRLQEVSGLRRLNRSGHDRPGARLGLGDDRQLEHQLRRAQDSADS